MKSPPPAESRTCLFESDARVYAKVDPGMNTNYGRWKRELPSLAKTLSKKALKRSPMASKANLNRSIKHQNDNNNLNRFMSRRLKDSA